MLNRQTPLPPQLVVLSVTENKVQLIELICQNLIDVGQQRKQSQHRLIIMGPGSTPVEIHHEPKGVALI